MTRSIPHRRKDERGAALIVVLLLVATLSFILLSITNIVTAGVRRASSERARAELLWRAAAAEQIAAAIIRKATPDPAPKMAAGEGIFADQLELPFENGTGSIIFDDATGCFNVNDLVDGSAGSYSTNRASMENFVRLMEQIGLGSGEANKLAEVIADFMDSDAMPDGQGAEDGFYTALPTPYRTAGQPIASISELRAMDGVSRDLYRRIRPYLCAQGSTDQPPINVNMVNEEHAPILFAAFGGATPIEDIKAAIAERPPGGYSDAAALPAALAVPAASLTSKFIKARIRLELGDGAMEETLLFEADPGRDPKLLARTFGDDF